jgi:hypothetical protein
LANVFRKAIAESERREARQRIEEERKLMKNRVLETLNPKLVR